VETAEKIGLQTVCVLTGGVPEEVLREAGAVAVYEHVGDLLAHLDESPVGKQIKR
jgi:phosphoglycolate phosphatase-like HAD superfamily hydrolase